MSPPSHPPVWGSPSPQGWGRAVLGFAGAPLLFSVASVPHRCPLAGALCLKPHWGGSFHCGGCPSLEARWELRADTEPWGCVCVCALGGHKCVPRSMGWAEPRFGPGVGGGCWGAQQAQAVMPALSAGTAEAGEPICEERLAARPWRGRRLQVGWGQGQGWGQAPGATHGPLSLERCLMPTRT